MLLLVFSPAKEVIMVVSVLCHWASVNLYPRYRSALWFFQPFVISALDSSVGRALAFGADGRGFKSQPHHTKGVKMILADARMKEVVLHVGI